MSGRNMSAAMLAEIAKQAVQVFELVEMYFDGGTDRFTTWNRNIDWGGNTYLATGHLLQLGDVNEDVALTIGATTIQLSGVALDAVAIALTENYTDRRVIIRRGCLDTAGGIIVDPVIIFDGRLDGFSLAEDRSTATLSWTVASHWADFDKSAGRRTNLEDQKIHFPNDTGFRWTAQVARDIAWGRV